MKCTIGRGPSGADIQFVKNNAVNNEEIDLSALLAWRYVITAPAAPPAEK